MRGTRTVILLSALAGAALLAPGCGGRVLEGASRCQPGDARTCWCTNVNAGVQHCDPDTARWELCECDAVVGVGGTTNLSPNGVRSFGGAPSAGAPPVGLGGRGTGGSVVVGSGGSVEPTDEVCYGIPFDGTEPAPDCIGEAYEARRPWIDLYLMMDRSVSMLRDVAGTSADPAPAGESRWDGVVEAIRQLVAEPSLADVGLGLQFFGADLFASEELNCDPGNYSDPFVPVGDFADVGDEILAAYDTMGDQLGGLTPTLPALQGAIAYAASVRAQRRRPTAVVLVTDGQPTQCQDPISVAEVAEEAERGLLEDEVSTYVIGLGPGLFNLHRVAQFGGTDEAFLIEDGDAVDQFRAAIMNIANTVPRCEFELPSRLDPTQELDPDEVQLVFRPDNGPTEELPRLVIPADCPNSPNGGWYYDSTSNPQSIGICDCNCNRLGEGFIEMILGCAPRIFDDG